VDRPELIPSAVAFADVPPKSQWSLRLYGVDHFLRVRLEEPQGAQEQNFEPDLATHN
jgi:hypothetical protein